MHKQVSISIILAAISTLVSCIHGGNDKWIKIFYFEPTANLVPYNTAPTLRGSWGSEGAPGSPTSRAWITSYDQQWKPVIDRVPPDGELGFTFTAEPITKKTTYTLTVEMEWGAKGEHWTSRFKSSTCDVDISPQSTTAALPNGDYIVVGGTDGEGLRTVSAKVDRWKASLGSWRPTATLNVARRSPSVTALSDGRVLVSGGMDAGGNFLVSEEIYDPNMEQWTFRQ